MSHVGTTGEAILLDTAKPENTFAKKQLKLKWLTVHQAFESVAYFVSLHSFESFKL